MISLSGCLCVAVCPGALAILNLVTLNPFALVYELPQVYSRAVKGECDADPRLTRTIRRTAP